MNCPLVATAAPGSDGTPSWISGSRGGSLWLATRPAGDPAPGRPAGGGAGGGVWRDYARQTGTIMIDLAAYRQLTGDLLASDAALTLAPGSDSAAVVAALASPAGTLEIARLGNSAPAAWPSSTAPSPSPRAGSHRRRHRPGGAASFAALAAARRREFGMLRHLGVVAARSAGCSPTKARWRPEPASPPAWRRALPSAWC